MKTRLILALFVAMLLSSVPAAQVPAPAVPLATRYTDPINGLSLEQATALARDQEPRLRAARTEIDVARGLRVQAGLRSNPSVTVERREEPAGSDNQTAVGVQWPLDLFRVRARVAAAERDVDVTRLAVADRERLLVSEVRSRYGEVAAAARNLDVLEHLVSATRRQHELLRARAEEGASPPLERDLLFVELQRLESDLALQAGRTEAALFELKRVLGMPPDAAVTIRDTLDEMVQREALPAAGASTDGAAALQQRPDVREAAARVAAAAAKIDRAEAEGRFDVSLFGNYMRMDAGFPQLGLTRDGTLQRVRGVFHNLAIGASVTVPLLNRNQGFVAAARAEQEGAAAAYEAAQLAARTELAVARTLDQHAHQAAKLYGGGAQALARQNLAVVAESYQLGRVTVFDVLAEQRRYFDVERGYTEALRAAYEARTALTRALGDFQ